MRLPGPRLIKPSLPRRLTISVTLGGETFIARERLVGVRSMPASLSQYSDSRYSCIPGLKLMGTWYGHGGTPSSPTLDDHPAGRYSVRSLASRAAAQPAAGSPTARRRFQPIDAVVSSQHHQVKRSSARPSSSGSGGQSTPASAAAAHQASKRPSAAPRRTPYAPPLAAAHAMRA